MKLIGSLKPSNTVLLGFFYSKSICKLQALQNIL
jgi:hypothetical protein